MHFKYVVLSAINLLVLPSFAQDALHNILSSIERNNATLNTLKAEAEALIQENHTGLTLPNPEVAFSYLWGVSHAGPKRSIEISQSLDAPTLLGYKRSIARTADQRTWLQIKTEQWTILQKARQTGIELIYLNAQMAQMDRQIQEAKALVTHYNELLQTGETSILDANKAQMNLSLLQNEQQALSVQRDETRAALCRLNGGHEVSLPDTVFPKTEIPSDFEQWFAQICSKYPELQLREAELLNKQQNLRLRKAEGLPELSIGYAFENEAGEKHQGITLGISIPLWANRKRVKQAKLAVTAAKQRKELTLLEIRTRWDALHKKALAQQKNAQNIRKAMIELNNRPLQQKALLAGEISIVEYLSSQEMYYALLQQALQAEYEYNKTATALMPYNEP